MNKVGIFEDLFNKATIIYNVNPYIFIALYIISIPIYYYGHYAMIKSGYQYYKYDYKINKVVNLGDILKSRGFLRGLIINRSAWALPYIYIMIVGKNLPIWAYALIIIWLALTSVLAVWKTKTKFPNRKTDNDTGH